MSKRCARTRIGSSKKVYKITEKTEWEDVESYIVCNERVFGITVRT